MARKRPLGNAGTVVTLEHRSRVLEGNPLGDPHVQQGRYHRWPEYSQSKLANLLFTFELDRRLQAAGLPVEALAAHPGYAGTHLVANGRFGRSAGGAASIIDAEPSTAITRPSGSRSSSISVTRPEPQPASSTVSSPRSGSRSSTARPHSACGVPTRS